MKFKGYGEIENTYSSKLIEKVRSNGLDKDNIVYACYRKIDGSNVQFSIDENDDFICASRNQIIGKDNNFGNYKQVVERDDIERKIRNIKNMISSFHVNDESLNEFVKDNPKFCLTIFGELCGGLYRHKDVPKDKNSVRIQGRIDYSPSNQWIPFDIRVSSETSSMLINLDTAKQLCEAGNLLYQIEEFRGTFNECLNFPIEFIDDTGNRFWNLPIIENNIAEGVVIKPIIPTWIGDSRVIFKNKNPKFKERIRATKENNKNNHNLKEKELYWFNILKEYMNENRVLSAISKVGNDNFGNLMKESCCDAIKDFKNENKDEFEKDEREFDPKDFNFSNVTKAFNKFSCDIVRKVFLENR